MLPNQSNIAQTYTDINSLQGIRSLGKADKSAALMETAKQFESMFVSMMLDSMRKANAVFEEDDFLHSSEMDFYQGMYDQQLALTLSSGQGVGLAPVIYRQLEQAYGAQTPVELNQTKLFNRSAKVIKPLHEQALAPTMEAVGNLRDAQRKVQPLQSEPPAAAVKPQASTVTPSTSAAAEKGQYFASAEDFVAALYPQAEKIGQELGVDPKAIVAQAALETGWGRYMIGSEGKNSFNFFGIKADSRWQGERMEVTTSEFMDGRMVKQRAYFRAYDNLEDGLRDYASFLQGSERYQAALNNNLTSEHYGHALQQAGYATDPEYGAKIKRIAMSDTLSSALYQLEQGN